MDSKALCKEVIRISGIDPRKCMKCGKCSATCPAFEDMDIHPHEFVSMLCDERIDRLLSSKSLWRCVSCFACVERCPRGVEPARLIEAVRVCLIRNRNENFISPDEIPAMLDPQLPQQAIVSTFRKFRK